MGDIVDLDAFRKQREEEEKAKAKAEADAKAAEDEAELELMQEMVSRIVSSLGEILTGSSNGYYSAYDSDYFDFNTTYIHEAGYDDDGYYERSWELDPFSPNDEDYEEDEPDF